MMYNTVVVCLVASIMCNSLVLCVGFVRLGWVCYEFGLGWVGVRVLWTKGVLGLGWGRVGLGLGWATVGLGLGSEWVGIKLSWVGLSMEVYRNPIEILSKLYISKFH